MHSCEKKMMSLEYIVARNPFVDDYFIRKWRYIAVRHSSELKYAAKDWESLRHYHLSYMIDNDVVDESEFKRLKKEEPGEHFFKEAYSDIGYHYGIEESGGIYIVRHGRSLSLSGAHTFVRETGNYFNKQAIGICVLGGKKSNNLDEKSRLLLVSLCRLLLHIYKIPPEHIIGIKDILDISGVDVADKRVDSGIDIKEIRNTCGNMKVSNM